MVCTPAPWVAKHNHHKTEDTRCGSIFGTFLTRLNGAVLPCVIGWHYYELIYWHIALIMWRKLLYSGFETWFGQCNQGAWTNIHCKSRFCAILKKGKAKSQFVRGWHVAFDARGARWGVTRSIYLTNTTYRLQDQSQDLKRRAMLHVAFDDRDAWWRWAPFKAGLAELVRLALHHGV